MPRNKEYINREEALRQIFLEAMGHDFDFNAEYRKIYISARRAIKNTPAADVVEVVRCKDCQHYYNSVCTNTGLAGTNIFMNPFDYCSYGEKMDKEE